MSQRIEIYIVIVDRTEIRVITMNFPPKHFHANNGIKIEQRLNNLKTEKKTRTNQQNAAKTNN